ncbi:TolB family protein [Flavobacterium sp.]|uniref:TolB family protein n=1 Tax=Flavobacterium sp. TaxID=239 RepID=UPI0037947C35
MKCKTTTLAFFFLLALLSCSSSTPNFVVPAVPIDKTPQPVLTGKMVYHTYSCYNCSDSKLYLYNFSTNEITFLSQNWTITNSMNAHFSPDGTKIVFMGMAQPTSNWDVFIYTLGTNVQPQNLTKNSLARDEDPKFSPDGTKIVFKQNGVLKEMDTSGNILRSFIVPNTEASMPYYTADGNSILYSGSEANNSATADIIKYSMLNNTTQPLAAMANINEYYPITVDANTFLFTQSTTSDQVYLGYFNGTPSLKLPFNESDSDFSDAFPVNSHTVVLSSTRIGGRGQYDLYLADEISGKKWSLNLYNPYINSSNNELGACYSPL